jgi:predicted PurR-regulated permease PerM
MESQSTTISLLLNWRLHLIVIAMSVISEWVGIQSIPVANAKLLFLPLFYAFVLCLFINPNITKFSQKIITKKNASIAAPIIVIGILPFIAKFGTLIGPALPKIAEAGSAMILQELGNLWVEKLLAQLTLLLVNQTLL